MKIHSIGLLVATCMICMASSASAAQDAQQRPGFIGLRMTDLDDVSASDLGLDSSKGVLIIYVVPSSPAEKAGVRVNDVIRRFNGQPVDSRGDMGQRLREMRAGDTVTLTLIRKSQPVDITLTLAERPQDQSRVRPELPN